MSGETPVAIRQVIRRSILRRILIVGAATVSMVGVVAGPASASQTCSGLVASNVCLGIWPLGNGNYAVHVGIDDRVSRSDAQAIIDQPGDPFYVVVVDDSGNPLFIVPETDIGASAESGLSADFDTVVVPGQLGGRTVRARVRLDDRRAGTRFFTSPRLSSPY